MTSTSECSRGGLVNVMSGKAISRFRQFGTVCLALDSGIHQPYSAQRFRFSKRTFAGTISNYAHRPGMQFSPVDLSMFWRYARKYNQRDRSNGKHRIIPLDVSDN
jgi:hypothetical protein